MNKSIKSYLASALLVAASSSAILSLSGCAGVVESGKLFDTQQVAQIQKGTTTKRDVARLLGEPPTTREDETGSAWSYAFSSVSFLNETRNLDIYFNKAGIVTDYTYRGGKSLF